jgi:ferredoxin-NADP reductase
MEQHIVKLLSIEPVTHDVRHLVVERPEGYNFIPGQATEVSLNRPGWEDNRHPFTFTCLEDTPNLEFVIKIYPERHGITEQIGMLKPGDELIIHDIWGTINYKGPGYFIAGGAGITPFIAILRDLHGKNKLDNNVLLFSNKTEKDIILKDEFEKMLGENAVFTLTDEKTTKYENRMINEDFLKDHVKDFSRNFYVCGPDPMIASIRDILTKLGAKTEEVVFEK